jgi:hypothetical protein
MGWIKGMKGLSSMEQGFQIWVARKRVAVVETGRRRVIIFGKGW